MGFYPAFADTIIVGVVAAAALYGCYWLVARYPEQRKKRRALREQEQADENEYWQYRRKHDAVRDKYDPRQRIS